MEQTTQNPTSKKCDNPECDRQTPSHIMYCCFGCAIQASRVAQGSFELIRHTGECNRKNGVSSIEEM